jgi:hypothetical protein
VRFPWCQAKSDDYQACVRRRLPVTNRPADRAEASRRRFRRCRARLARVPRSRGTFALRSDGLGRHSTPRAYWGSSAFRVARDKVRGGPLTRDPNGSSGLPHSFSGAAESGPDRQAELTPLPEMADEARNVASRPGVAYAGSGFVAIRLDTTPRADGSGDLPAKAGVWRTAGEA